MKQRFLLLVATLLMGSVAFAQELTAEWQKPAEPSKADAQAVDIEIEDEDQPEYYLYNVDAKGFFTEGNAWGTQASLSKTGGLKVKISQFYSDLDWSETHSICINDFSITKNNWVQLFIDNESQLFVDHGTQAGNCEAFQLVEQGDNVYRIAPAIESNYWILDAEEPYQFLGIITDEEGAWVNAAGEPANVLFPLLDPDLEDVGQKYNVDWIFVTPEVFNAYTEGMAIYEAAEALREAIINAQIKCPGIDIAAQIAVYNNTASTADELEQAKNEVNAAVVDFMKGNATPDNPVDVTALYIPNPTFDNANLSGWSGTAFGRGGVTADGAEHYEKNYDTYIEISGLDKGVYAFSCDGYYRAGSSGSDWTAQQAGTSFNAKIYLKGDTFGEVTTSLKHPSCYPLEFDPGLNNCSTVGDGYYIPNTMAAAEYWFAMEERPYYNVVVGAVGEGDVVRIGVKKETLISMDWSLFDNFKLEYYGDSPEAYDIIKNNIIADATLEVGEGVYYGKPDYDAYYEVLEAYKSASGVDEIYAGVENLAAAKETFAKGISAYNEYVAACQKAIEWLQEADIPMSTDAIEKLEDYVDTYASESDALTAKWGFPHGTANHIINVKEDQYVGILSCEEIIEETEYVNSLLSDAVRSNLVPGMEVTYLIKNPGFETGLSSGHADGWTVTRGDSEGNVTPGPLDTADQNHCFESWHCHNFDVWQELKDLPPGIYELQAQGFVRCEVSGYQRGDIGENCPKSPIYLYMNDARAYFPNVYEENKPEDEEYVIIEDWTKEEINGYEYPNSMGGAGQCFGRWGMYKMSAYGMIVNDGDVFRIGVKGVMDSQSHWWCIWDNFKLIYQGKSETAIRAMIDNYITFTDNLYADADLQGTRIFLKDKEALDAARDKADKAQGVDNMYDALIEFIAAFNAADDGVIVMEDLQKALDNLTLVMEDETIIESADPDVLTDAQTFIDDVVTEVIDFADQSSDNEEVDKYKSSTTARELIDLINEWIEKIKTPVIIPGATPENPQNITQLITNPTFLGDQYNGWAGSGFGGVNPVENAERFQMNFDTYQDIKVPVVGTYKVSVLAAIRAGGAEEDYAALQAAGGINGDKNADETLTACLYAKNGNVTVSERIPHMSVAASEMRYAGTESLCHTETIEATEEEDGYELQLYIPNDMAAWDAYAHASADGSELYMEETIADSPYNVSVTINVTDEADRTLRIGVYKQSTKDADWCIFDDFRLEWLGQFTQANSGDYGTVAIADVETTAKTTPTAIYTVSGARVATLQRGINIVKTYDANGNVRISKVLVK